MFFSWNSSDGVQDIFSPGSGKFVAPSSVREPGE